MPAQRRESGRPRKASGAAADGSEWLRSSTLDDLVGELAPRYKTVGEMVYEVIRNGILNATFAPGERLRQEALAEAIGVSRIPVRSALLQLESEGLVVFHPRRGAVVKSLTPEQIAEIYELRELLEVHALRRSMARMTPERLARLRSLSSQLDALEEGAAFLAQRVEFYRELYDAQNSPRLVEMIEGLRSSVGRYLLGWRVSHDHGGSHRELVDAMESGDADAAERTLREHLHEVRAGIETILQGQLAANAATSAARPRRTPRKATAGAGQPAHR